MAAPGADSKIFRPYVHSLLHLAAVKVATPLCNDILDLASLVEAFENVPNESYHTPIENPSELKKCKAEKYILSIPPGLRKTVFGAARGLNYAAFLWQNHHKDIIKLEDGDCFFYWRSDGRIDGLKTAYHVVRDINIDIKQRFYLACRYCFEDTIKTLWAEMGESGETENLKTSHNSIARFWIKRLRNGSRVCWRKSIKKFFRDPRNCHEGTRYSSFFSSLRPEERIEILCFLDPADVDDYRTCFFAITKEEEEEIMKKRPLAILAGYLERPMRSFFLVTVDQMWNYMNERDFRSLVEDYFIFRMAFMEPEFYELFESFWNISPVTLRESVRKIPRISEKIDSCFNDIKKKRKAECDEIRKSKKKRKISETEMENSC